MNFSAKGSSDVVESYGIVTAGVGKPETFKETINMVKGAKDSIDAYTNNISQYRNFDREMDGFERYSRLLNALLKTRMPICKYRYDIKLPEMNSPCSPLNCHKGSSRHYLAPPHTMTACESTNRRCVLGKCDRCWAENRDAMELHTNEKAIIDR